MAATRRGRACGPDLHETLTATTAQVVTSEDTPHFDEDFDILIREAVQFWEAGDSVLANALLSDSYDDLVVAAGHSIVCSARARRLLSVALHVDLEAVA